MFDDICDAWRQVGPWHGSATAFLGSEAAARGAKKERKRRGKICREEAEHEVEEDYTPGRAYPRSRTSPRHFPPLLWFMRAMRVATGHYIRVLRREGWSNVGCRMARDRLQRDYKGSSSPYQAASLPILFKRIPPRFEEDAFDGRRLIMDEGHFWCHVVYIYIYIWRGILKGRRKSLKYKSISTWQIVLRN